MDVLEAKKQLKDYYKFNYNVVGVGSGLKKLFLYVNIGQNIYLTHFYGHVVEVVEIKESYFGSKEAFNNFKQKVGIKNNYVVDGKGTYCG